MTCHFRSNQANCRVDVYFLQIGKCRLNISLPTIIVLSWETNLAIIFKNSTEVGRGHKKLLEGSCNAIGLISSCLFLFKKKFVLKWTLFEIVFSHPQNKFWYVCSYFLIFECNTLLPPWCWYFFWRFWAGKLMISATWRWIHN